jgi:hypothetical protein
MISGGPRRESQGFPIAENAREESLARLSQVNP